MFDLVKDRDRELADTFDGLRRSTALFQLAVMRKRDLITDEEFSRFTDETRDRMKVFLCG